jgi:hypothetical protein
MANKKKCVVHLIIIIICSYTKFAKIMPTRKTRMGLKMTIPDSDIRCDDFFEDVERK